MKRPVVSAEDVRAARRRNELRVAIPDGAIITPLAREEADRWGIMLASAPEPGRHRSTCDPDDVDRVVDRVRARVPAADPAVVRRIARRILEEDTR